MDNLETQPAAPSFPEPPGNSRDNPQRLQQRQMFLLGAILILTMSMNLFLLSQVIWLGKDLGRNQQVVAEYEANDGPVLGKFYNQLVEFARGHSDFVPILVKYRLVTVTPPPQSGPPQKGAPK